MESLAGNIKGLPMNGESISSDTPTGLSTIGTKSNPRVLIENGHITAVTLALIDVPKEEENGNDGQDSKVIVVPFDRRGPESRPCQSR
jgi:hypothetical protein